jgi:hypothetical protein
MGSVGFGFRSLGCEEDIMGSGLRVDGILAELCCGSWQASSLWLRTG